MRRASTLIVWGMFVAGSVWASRGAAIRAEPATAPATQSTTPDGFMPITYFEDKCSNCHGPYGSAYGAEFGKRLSEDELTRVVDDMCAGPANAPVEAPQLKVLVEYHKAMIAKKPFVVVTKARSQPDGIVLDGEVRPGSTVEVGGLPAKVTGHLWTVQVPARPEIQIVAKQGGATTSIRFTH